MVCNKEELVEGIERALPADRAVTLHKSQNAWKPDKVTTEDDSLEAIKTVSFSPRGMKKDWQEKFFLSITKLGSCQVIHLSN